MDDIFKIYIEQLRDGHELEMNEIIPPDFLEVNEADLSFKKDVKLEGSAYIAEHELILHWNIHAEALIPCSICNEKVLIDIEILNFYYSEPVENIKSGIFNYKDVLRETILLEVPPFAEHEGNCPKRKEIAQYLKDNEDSEEEGYKPFADLDLK